MRREAYTADQPVAIKKEAFDVIDHTQITWLAGTGFLINARGTILFIDPILKMKQGEMVSEIGLKMKVSYAMDAADVPRADAVMYTHADDDHLGLETLRAMRPDRIIGTYPSYERLTRNGFAPDNITVCRYRDRLEIGNVSIEVMKADHPWQLQNPQRYGKPFRENDCCGFRVTTPDCTFLNPGDTRLMEEHLYLEPVDVLGLDVSHCHYHLGTQGATNLANVLKDAILMPYHWGTYDKPDVPAHCGCPEEVYENAVNKQRQRIFAPGVPLRMKDGKEL